MIDMLTNLNENTNNSKLHPLLPEIIGKQATINIGTIGHVAHGKTTVVRAISGVHTIRHKNELIRNITIKLGYANAKIYECDNMDCPRPERYSSAGSNSKDILPCQRINCSGNRIVKRHVSFVDCPGHDILMATMLNGAAVMDAAFLIIAGNESCPQPQTKEHLAAIDIMKLKNICIMQNKIDLIKETQARDQHKEIVNFINGTAAQNATIIPISAQLNLNIDYICDYIINKIPAPIRDFTSHPLMMVIRSFDVNKPGCEVDELRGGVAGGSILRGVLRVGQTIEIRPGIISKDSKNVFTCIPIISTITQLRAEENSLNYAIPGGLIAVGTKIDSQICRADRLVGQVLGSVGHLPNIFQDIEISFYLLRRLLGVKVVGTKKGAKVEKLQKGEIIMINIGSLSSSGIVEVVKNELAKISLQNPVCCENGEKMALSRKIDKHWRLIGWGEIKRGTQIIPSVHSTNILSRVDN